VDLPYWLAQNFYDFMNGSPSLLTGWIYIVAAGAPIILLHELGHALVAVRRLDTDVEVTVGNAAEVAQLRLGQVNASVFALRSPLGPAGAASFDASLATARDVFWIALAGPVASAIGLAAVLLCYAAAPADGFVHNLLWAAVLTSFYGVLNLIPFRLGGEGPGPSASDGRTALDALRVIRELR
jgi:hypothetical protein